MGMTKLELTVEETLDLRDILIWEIQDCFLSLDVVTDEDDRQAIKKRMKFCIYLLSKLGVSWDVTKRLLLSFKALRKSAIRKLDKLVEKLGE